MVDRQDIDALLIGSLYGELSSAEEARLSAHLESHPADRTALANLTRAREIVHESRILQTQFDPPQSVSALLMQEAARRAPKPREEHGWFQRFMRSFLSHPAMAAAVMLVLVVGVAGTVYMRKGDNFAKATKDEAAPMVATPPAEPAPTATPGQEPAEEATQGATKADDYKVKLDDDTVANKEEQSAAAEGARGQGGTREIRTAESKQKGGNRELAFDGNSRGFSDGAPATETLAKKAPVTVDLDRAESSESGSAPVTTQAAAEPAKVAKAAPKPATKAPPRLDVTTPSPAPKDFAQPPSRDDGAVVATRRGDSSGAKKTEPSTGTGATVGGVSTGGGGADARPGSMAPTAPSPPPPPPPPAIVADERAKQDKEKAIGTTELAWAKERHGKAIAAVKAGKCEVAAGFVIEIANRVPGYYQASVADDRALKSCAAYITAQREREAERAQRAKATQRRAADEAPAPTNSTK